MLYCFGEIKTIHGHADRCRGIGGGEITGKALS